MPAPPGYDEMLRRGGAPAAHERSRKPALPKKQPRIKLANTARERTQLKDKADLYSIIVVTERLEQAYVAEAIDEEEYAAACQKLINQFRTLRDSVRDFVPSVQEFMGEYKMDYCKKAANRLLAKGVPATVELGRADNSGAAGNDQLSVFHAVQHFITTMDSLKLELRAVDEIHPGLSDLAESLTKVNGLPPDGETKTLVQKWLSKLHQMQAHDELSDEDVRQMSFELERAYSAFHTFLQNRPT